MGCSITERRHLAEVARTEYKRLRDLASQGYTEDAENGIYDIEEAMENMKAIIYNRPELMSDPGEAISTDIINTLNNNNPRRRNAPVTVVNGVKYKSGTVKYAVKYANNSSTYFINALELTADQVDPKQMTLGSTEKDLETKITEARLSKLELLELEIHKDVTKTVEMLDTLNELDGTKLGEGHLGYLKELLGSLNPEFFRKMNVYLDDKAKENGGIITSSEIIIGVSTRPDSMQSAAEVYAHELIHAYTKFAVEMAKKGDVEAREVLRKLEYVMALTRDNLSASKLVSEGVTKEQATEMYDYMFNSKASEHEFIAYVLTNPVVKNAVQKIKLNKKSESVWEKIKSAIAAVIGYMAGSYEFNSKGKNVFEVTTALAMKFAELNNNAKNTARNRRNLINRLSEAFNDFNDFDDDTSSKLQELFYKVLPSKEITPLPNNKLGRAKWYASLLAKVVFDKQHRDLAMTYLDKLGIMNISGSLASIIRDFVESDKLEKTIDWLQLQADKVDQSKMGIITTVSDNIRKGFTEELTQEQDEMLTSVVLNTNMQAVFDDYTQAQWEQMLTDDNKLNLAIVNAEKRLESLDKKHFYWHVNQAAGLGFFMASGKGHVAQNESAYNIARGALSAERKRPYVKTPGDLEALIHQVAVLTALKYTPKEDKKAFAELLVKETEGVENVIGVAKYAVKEADKSIFKGQKGFMSDGYTKEIFDDMVSVEIAKQSEEAEMVSRGYTKVVDLEPNGLVKVTEGYALYKSSSFAKNDWHRATTRLTKAHTRGTSLKDLWYGEDDAYSAKKFKINKNKIDTERYKIVKQMSEGKIDLAELNNDLLPLVNAEGDAVDYRYVMNKKVKKDVLKQNTRATDVLGATRGSILDKQRSIEHNAKVLKVLKEDAEENFVPGKTLGKNGLEYVVIAERSTVEEYRELWKVLPKEFKLEGMRNEERGLVVRKDMLHNYFGYREASLANFPGLSRYMPTMLKNAIRIAEVIWQEFIKIVKVDILIKMPFVIVGNIVSNIMFALTTGSSITDIFKMYTSSTRDVRNYLVKHREMLAVVEEVAAGKNTKANRDKIAALEKELKRSPIHELYELGIYQAIVEDVNKEELSSTNKIKRKYRETTAKMPKIVKDGVNWLYLTEETQYYKFMAEVLQMSDLVARDVENRKAKKIMDQQMRGTKKLPAWYINHLKTSDDGYAFRLRNSAINLDNRSRQMSREEKLYFRKVATDYRRNLVLNAFINYNKVSGPVEEYLNKMGFIMFTKYAKRIQRVIGETGVKYPLKSALTLLFDSYIWDMDTIQDQSLFTRSWYNMQPQYPWERIFEVMNPALVQMPKNLGL